MSNEIKQLLGQQILHVRKYHSCSITILNIRCTNGICPDTTDLCSEKYLHWWTYHFFKCENIQDFK